MGNDDLKDDVKDDLNNDPEDLKYDPVKKQYVAQIMFHVEDIRNEIKKFPDTEDARVLREKYQKLIEVLLKSAKREPVRRIKIHSTFGRPPRF